MFFSTISNLIYGEEVSFNTLPMYHIHEYCPSNNHARLEDPTDDPDPTEILQALVRSNRDPLKFGELTKTPARLINKIVTGARM